MLDGLTGWERASYNPAFWNWIEERDDETYESPGSGDTPTAGLSMQSFVAGGDPVLGAAELDEEGLVFTANSRPRTERGVALLTEALGAAVGEPLIHYTSAEEMLAQQAVEDGADYSAPADNGLSPEQEAEIVAQYKDEYYRKTLARPIPMLDNRSPRECLDDENGRARVIAWLKELENNEQRMSRQSGQSLYDTRWL